MTDSRHYIVALELHSPADCPPDFPAPEAFEAGLFLPREDPDWFGHSAYPPRVLLLTREALSIVPHPSAGESLARFPLARIASVEIGHQLLQGWLRVSADGRSVLVRYNTRGFPAISPFLARLREFLLTERCPVPESHPVGIPDLKFANALALALQPGETVALQWFQTRPRVPADLLLRTDRRLLWITDRDGAFRSRYGTVVTYAPLRMVASIALETAALAVHLHGASPWRIPVAASDLPPAREFLSGPS